MTDEGDIPSIEYKMSLRRTNSMRKVDDLSLIFIDFYVPALTPRLSSTDKGMVRSDMSKPALIFFSLQEYTQQNTLSKF
jgi:hypothetical protein